MVRSQKALSEGGPGSWDILSQSWLRSLRDAYPQAAAPRAGASYLEVARELQALARDILRDWMHFKALAAASNVS